MKAAIDKWFNDNYVMLIGVTRAKCKYFGRDICPEVLVHNAYLYLIERKNDFTETEFPAWAMNYINTELSFYNSKTLRSEAVKVSDEKAPDIIQEIDIESEIDERDFLNSFLNTLDRYEQNIWVMYLKGIDTSGKIAEHLMIDRTSAYFLKKNIETKFRKYVQTEKGI